MYCTVIVARAESKAPTAAITMRDDRYGLESAPSRLFESFALPRVLNNSYVIRPSRHESRALMQGGKVQSICLDRIHDLDFSFHLLGILLNYRERKENLQISVDGNPMALRQLIVETSCDSFV